MTTLKQVFFATLNEGKFEEAKLIGLKYGLLIEQLPVRTLEIQSENLQEIVEARLADLLSKHTDKLPALVEDAGLFVEALNGFPGPYSSYVHHVLGSKGILKLMESVKNRSAFFFSALAYNETHGKPAIFIGKVDGEIVLEERGSGGFGFDPIFKPSNSNNTFAEMTPQEKNTYSHRAKALIQLVEWLLRQRQNI